MAQGTKFDMSSPILWCFYVISDRISKIHKSRTWNHNLNTTSPSTISVHQFDLFSPKMFWGIITIDHNSGILNINSESMTLSDFF